MKIKTILLLLALCVTMGVSSQGRIEPGNEVAMKLYKEAAKKEYKNPSYSMAMYESLAKDGYAPAQYIMYKKGKGDKWLEQAAVGGHFEAATSDFLSQRLKQCEQVVDRSRAFATRASNGEPISEQEMEMLWDERQAFDQVYRQMESMQGYLFAAAVAKDANFFPPYFKGKKDMQRAQWEIEALCRICRDKLAQMEMEFGQQMDIIKASAKKTAMTASANGQQTDKTFTVKGVTFVMRPVAGGTFQMGYESYPLQNPPHSVTLSSYYIGQMEVTQALWQAVMGSNPSNFKGNYLPVETVSWDDCQTFITKLNQLTGQKFRLPTEAEWEYAARGGQKSKGYKYSGSDALDDLAWYWKNSGDSALSGKFTLDRAKANNGKTHPIAKMQANELGLYDMSGNVFEWCQDWYGENYYKSSPSKNPSGPTSGSDRVVRGGCWSSLDWDCLVYSRVRHEPSSRDNRIGFRLALSSNSSASTATQKTTMTAGAGAQMRYHDVELNDAKGKVKSISTNSVVWGEPKLMTVEFSVDGKQKGVTDAEYDSNGYRIKSTNKNNNEITVTTKYIWENGRLIEVVTASSINDITMSFKIKYNNKGEQIEWAMDMFKFQYSDYKYDSRGNWISRKNSGMGTPVTETRTIVYY